MRIRNKRRRHYAKHGWKKFLDSYLKFNYEITFSEPYAVNDQLVMDVNIAGKNTGLLGRRADVALLDEADHILQAMATNRFSKDGNDE